MTRRLAPVFFTLAMVMVALPATSPAQRFPTLRPEQQTPPQQPPAAPVPRPPSSQTPPRGQQPPAQAVRPADAPNVIARVDGRPILETDFERVAEPYVGRLRAQLGPSFSENIAKVANHNVLNELIRRELVVIESQRQKIAVTDAEVEEVLRQDPFFLTNGKFDPAKLARFKLDPTSNYQMIMPKLREMAASAKLDRNLRARFTPGNTVLRTEWNKRNEQVSFVFLPLLTRDMPLEPEATREEQLAYYADHSEQFMRRPRVRLRYVNLSLPPEGDSARAAAEGAAMTRGRGLADSLRAGASIDTLALSLGGALDTGLFDLPPSFIPGVGAVPDLMNAIAHADSDTTIRVVGPAPTPNGVVVAIVAERQRRHVPPFAEVLADVKRRADSEKRRLQIEADKRALYEARSDSYRSPRVTLTRVTLGDAAVKTKDPTARNVEQWWAANGRAMSPDSTLRPLNDSLRTIVRERWSEEQRLAQSSTQLARVVADWRANRNLRGSSRPAGAVAETLTLVRGTYADTTFAHGIVDSMYADHAGYAPGSIHGPRRFGVRTVVWRIDAADTSYVPPFDVVRGRVEQAYQEDKKQKEEAEAKVYFEAHRAEYKSKPKYVLEYMRAMIPPPDSVRVPEAELRRHYERNAERYKEEERVRARHILISSDPARTPGGESKAKERADSLRKALDGGADFVELARQFSHDGSGAGGGDLGFFGRGRMVKEFEDSSFALPKGRVSQPVKTRFGYHLIEVQEHQAAGAHPFAEVRNEIHDELARGRADSLARRSVLAKRRAIAAGGNVAKIAAPLGGVQTAGPFAIFDPIPGLGMMPELSQDLEKLPVARWAPKAYKTTDGYVIVRPSRRMPPGPAEFDEVKRQVVEDMKNVKRKEMLTTRVAAIRERLAAGAVLDSVAMDFGGLRESGFLTRQAAFVPGVGQEARVVTKAFALPAGTVTDSIQVSQGVVWIRPAQKKAVEGASFARDKDAIAQEMLAKNYEDWITAKKKTVRIEVLRADLREPPPPPTFTQTIKTQ